MAAASGTIRSTQVRANAVPEHVLCTQVVLKIHTLAFQALSGSGNTASGSVAVLFTTDLPCRTPIVQHFQD